MTQSQDGLPHVWVLTISHRCGSDISVHATPESAAGALHAYVADWWTAETRRADRPADPWEAVTAYMDAAREGYEITPLPLHGALAVTLDGRAVPPVHGVPETLATKEVSP